MADSKTGQNQYIFSGFLTFTNDIDAETYKTKIFALIDSKDVVYALVYYLGNDHQLKNPNPDIIYEKIEIGDACAVINYLPCYQS